MAGQRNLPAGIHIIEKVIQEILQGHAVVVVVIKY